MKRSLSTMALTLTGLAAISLAPRAHAQAFSLDITTEYLAGFPAGATFLGGGNPGPDTGFFVVTNSGTSTFMGTISDIAVSGNGPDLSVSFPGVTLAPGDSVSVAAGDEASNAGGFGPNGVTINVNGLINGTEALSISTNDASIHSGVPRLNPFGDTLDNFVIQGGDSQGRDTTDGYEETQAFGHINFSGGTTNVPEPGSLAALASLGLTGVGFFTRRRRQANKAA